jgi:hypothetical protein
VGYGCALVPVRHPPSHSAVATTALKLPALLLTRNAEARCKSLACTPCAYGHFTHNENQCLGCVQDLERPLPEPHKGYAVTASCPLNHLKKHRGAGGSILRAGRWRGRSSNPCRVKNVLFSTSSRPALRPTQPLFQSVPGVLSSGVRRPEREAERSHPTSAEVKKRWIYPSTPLYAFTA